MLKWHLLGTKYICIIEYYFLLDTRAASQDPFNVITLVSLVLGVTLVSLVLGVTLVSLVLVVNLQRIKVFSSIILALLILLKIL
jgi:hypothetical protein